MRTALTLLMLCSPVFAVPAPREKTQPAQASPAECAIGYWSVNWGDTIRQGCHFLDDGTYCSPEFGSGPWYSDGAVNVTFREGRLWWVLTIETYDRNVMTGYVRGMSWDGHIGDVKIRMTMRRGERIRAEPREAK